MSKYSQIDWMGRWYDIMRERGENDMVTFGKINLKTNQVEWKHFSHSKMDGIGALVYYYGKDGIALQNLPALKEKKSPSLLETIIILWRLIFLTKKITPQWKEKNIDLKPKDIHQVAWKILNVIDTKKIEEYCRKNKISENAFYMNVTSHVLLSELTLNKAGTWTLPINLRPILSKESFISNHSSGMLVTIKENDSIQTTHTQIKERFIQKQHWGIWWVHQVGKIVGLHGMRFISKRNSAKTFLIGSFSNMGKWELPPNEIWIGNAPGSKNFPISFFVMKANDHTSLSMKIHPFVMKDDQHVTNLLNKVSDRMLEIIAKE